MTVFFRGEGLFEKPWKIYVLVLGIVQSFYVSVTGMEFLKDGGLVSPLHLFQ